MKKLVVMAAVLVAAASTYAQCQPEDPVHTYCAQAYNVSMSLKTTAGKSGTTKVQCADPDVACYRVQAKRTLKGYYFVCECGCDEQNKHTFENNLLYLWDSKTKEGLVINELIDWGALGRIGKKNTEVEAEGEVEGVQHTFYLMGFGKYDAKNDRISSLSGSVQTWFDTPQCEFRCDPSVDALPYDLCTLVEIDAEYTIAYGTFSMKYSSSLSKKLVKQGVSYMLSLIPPAALESSSGSGEDGDSRDRKSVV